VKRPYDKRRKANSSTNPKTEAVNPHYHRIPIVSRPFVHNREMVNSDSVGVLPFSNEFSEMDHTNVAEQKQSVSIVVENPFDCLASFFFPEHVEFNKSIEDKKSKSEPIDPDYADAFSKSQANELQEAEEEFKFEPQNTEVQWTKDSDRSDVLHNVPNLVKILQTKSQKKVILEERK